MSVHTPFITFYSYIALLPLCNIVLNCPQQGRIGIDQKDEGTSAACLSFLKKHVRQRRYELKKKYFVGVPADQVLATSPVPSMSNKQWSDLVDKWSASKHKVSSIASHFPLYNCDVVEQRQISWYAIQIGNSGGV